MAAPTKCYNIIDNGENSAELTMYGEVVATRPYDYWNGQPIPGNYIALDEFLPELDKLKDKDNITVHINSVGGDFYAGLAIYNRLRNLKANITTINDSLAASAGSIILQAGNIRKVRAASNTMVHSVFGLAYGYYNVKDLEGLIKQLEAGNKAAIVAYAEAGGQDPEQIKKYMDEETWFTGQEAVDAGFADEVIEPETKLEMSMAKNRSFMEVNGLRISARWLPNTLPNGINILEETALNKNYGGNDPMSKNISTVEELRAAYPELTAQLETAVRNEAMAQGVKNERTRLQAIEDIRNGIGNAELIRNAMFGDEPMTAEQLAFQAIKANAVQGNSVLNNLKTDTQQALQVAPAAAPPITPSVIDQKAAFMDDVKAIVNVIKK